MSALEAAESYAAWVEVASELDLLHAIRAQTGVSRALEACVRRLGETHALKG